MVRRERTYSDPRIISLLNERFVTAAININSLQHQDDDEGRCFRLIALQGRFKLSFEDALARVAKTDHKECHQGQFVATIEGELLGSRHTADPDDLLAMLNTALSNWDNRTTQKDTSQIADLSKDERYVWGYPEDGLVLHLGCTDLPREIDTRPDGEYQRTAHNQDFVWMTREEMLSIVPDGVQKGDRFSLPENIHRRLVRYHLLDIVRGETPPWAKDVPQDVAMELHVTDLDSDYVHMTLHGGGKLQQKGSWCTQPPRRSVYRRGQMCCLIEERGFEPALLGHLAFDRVQERFTRFDVLIVGTRWGGTTFNMRCDDTDAAPLGVAMTIANTDAFSRIPPHGNPRSYFEA
ncbi:MAG: hypothetical protein HOE48_10935 [Candidatus Latescibacteria bacterium]|nr:hypothetical protein [Candidatus Latescibacterota bacterium]